MNKEMPHSKTPVRIPMVSHKSGSAMYAGVNSRNRGMMYGIGDDARLLSKIARNHDSPPHRKNDIDIWLRFFQNTKEASATVTIPIP
jgi:hypothetical protein